MNFSISEKFIPVIESYAEPLQEIGDQPPPAPRWDQDWFPRLDAAAAYAMVRDRRPQRIVEVGSGHSTRFLARAVADGGLPTRITAIDPKPRASIAGLAVDTLRVPVQQAGTAPFSDLEAGDILFIDSSHQFTPGGDLEFIFQTVLPGLPRGIRLHLHDIFLPDDYPAHWAWRRYDEQPAVERLLADEIFSAEFSSHWIATRAAGPKPGLLSRLPLLPGAQESSLWLIKN